MTRLAAALLASAIVLGSASRTLAETPADTLVMAHAIDDMVSLDPAEIFDFTGAEYAGNTYDRLVGYDPTDHDVLVGVVAESWEIDEDRRTYRFKIREDVTFPSGNGLTAEDVAFSLRRAVLLDKAPAFVLRQLGLTPEMLEDRVMATGRHDFVLKTDKAYAPAFVLSCLTATVASIVDRQLLLSQELDGDKGHGWLRSNHAGSGPYMLQSWLPMESLTVVRHDGYWQGAPALRAVSIRSVPDAATRRMLLEKGEIDIARDLGAGQRAALEGNEAIRLDRTETNALYYLALNQRNGVLADPAVRQAFKHAIDYDGIADGALADRAVVHQSILPRGTTGALGARRYDHDPVLARRLLAAAGFPDGIAVALDVRDTAPMPALARAIRDSLAEAGIDIALDIGSPRQALGRYRSRVHDLYLGQWAPDYPDPHANTAAFALNPDDSEGSKVRSLAWRNHWSRPILSVAVEAALQEPDSDKRLALYQDLQRLHQDTAPFAILFQDVRTVGMRKGIAGFRAGPAHDVIRYADVTKAEE